MHVGLSLRQRNMDKVKPTILLLTGGAQHGRELLKESKMGPGRRKAEPVRAGMRRCSVIPSTILYEIPGYDVPDHLELVEH